MSAAKTIPCDLEQVVSLVGIRVIRKAGDQLNCRCPFCGDRKAHLNVRLSSNVWRCNRCGQGGGILHLYAKMHNISLNMAYDELTAIFGNQEPATARPVIIGPDQARVVSSELPLATTQVRDNTYSNLLSLLTLGSTHRESLLARGLSSGDIARLQYRTTPAVRLDRLVTELLDRGCVLEGVPGFYCDEQTGRWKLDIRSSGIMIPDRNSKGEIEAIQIRLDKAHKSKFNSLTSVGKYYGTPASYTAHFAGFAQGMDSVYLTEGIMKADVAHCLSIELGTPLAFVGLTGVSSINQYNRALDELKSLGVRHIYVAFDMDMDTNSNVAEARERAIQVGAEAGFHMSPINWSREFKGIDDYFLHRKQLNEEFAFVKEAKATEE